MLTAKYPFFGSTLDTSCRGLDLLRSTHAHHLYRQNLLDASDMDLNRKTKVEVYHIQKNA